ncbi:CRP/FNR family transcriptional regulator [Acetoanaerobium pronyense]|uniref:CRP/FNR family transcriptional regulator n=1 Tax=Acetoanaerobium pronyense TaxID=1482736 RepID=A0ABS4KGS0_9FIRM|nr:Crp/Fnr family transcriptional regulator [Acetoanaerobium pronyense]MBP2026948.1 CRP/FNR family transcriptional regulator [Acetoanaerobium pronyense]
MQSFLPHIKNLKGWETLNDVTKKKLINLSRGHVVNEDTILYLEGQSDVPIFIVLKGYAILSKFSEKGEEKILYIFSEGEFINELAVDFQKTSNSTRALKDSILISIMAKDLLKLMEEDFNLNLLVLKSLSKKVRRTQRQALNLGRLKTGQRIASRLWKLSRDYGIVLKDDSVLIDLPINQSNIGAMVGTSRETVSRFIKKLENENVLYLKGHKIVIKDRSALLNYVKLDD